MVRKSRFVVGAVLVAAAVMGGLAVAGNGTKNDKTFEYAVWLWGDLPYSVWGKEIRFGRGGWAGDRGRAGSDSRWC